MKNWNCDGGHCREPKGQVRVYPLGGGANLILCRACCEHENYYRAQRSRDVGEPDKWPRHEWSECEIYGDHQ
jgi:hypothetical protein